MKKIMRKTILLFIITICFHSSYAQIVAADPAISQMDIVNIDGVSEEFASYIAPNKTIRLKIPVFNLHQLNSIPANSCKLKINLGKYLALDPSFNLANAALNNYFKWTSALVRGNVEITGDLFTPMPGDFTGTAIFDLKAGNILGTDEIVTNFLITNQNTANILKDEDLNNNTASLQYTITRNLAPVPVNFTLFTLTKKACSIQVNFTAENPVNVSHFEIELSKDAINFKKMGELALSNFVQYKFFFEINPANTATQLFVRIKCVDNDGKFKYSETKIVSGLCNGKHLKAILFPNPVAGNKNEITIKAIDGVFNGEYSISLVNFKGKLINNQQLNLNALHQFNYKISGLPAGQFIVRLQKKDATQVIGLTFLVL